MVTSVTSLGRNGIHDYLVQRITALVLLAWVLFVVLFIATTPELDSLRWQALFNRPWMRVFTLAALLSLCAHAWVGMWTIATDYLTSAMFGKAATVVRLLFELFCLGVLFIYFVWCAQILWNI